MKQNGLWVIAFVIVALMVLTSVSPLSTNRIEEIDNSTYIISNTPPDNPELGDLWFDTTLDEMNIYNGYVWQSLVPTVSGAGYDNHAVKHYWGGVDPISFQKLSPNVRVASEFATSGSGTRVNPYMNAVKNAVDDLDGKEGIVLLNVAAFSEEDTITLYGGQAILGLAHGWSDSTLPRIQLAPNVNKDLVHITSDGVNDWTRYFPLIKDVMLDGNYWQNTEAGNCIYISGDMMDCFLDKVLCGNAREDGIRCHSGLKLYIRDCYLEHCQANGLNIETIGLLTIQGSYIFENKESGIWIDVKGGTKYIQNGNYICGNEKHGINLKAGVDNVYIMGNHISGNGNETGNDNSDIYAWTCNYTMISNNIIGGDITNTNYGIYIIDASSDNIHITDNIIKVTKTQRLKIESGANKNGIIKDNLGLNPFGIITNPFDTTHDLVHLTGNVAIPTASIDYTICLAPCRIISTDSGDANCSITIKDAAGNTIESGLSTYDNWLEVGWTINWGAFTGTAPTVKVIFT